MLDFGDATFSGGSTCKAQGAEDPLALWCRALAVERSVEINVHLRKAIFNKGTQNQWLRQARQGQCIKMCARWLQAW